MKKKINKSTKSVAEVLKGVWFNFFKELKTTFRDRGVVIMILIGPLVYPLLYATMYCNETVTEIPIAVVDESQTFFSHQLIRNLGATQELKIVGYCISLNEAKKAFDKREIHGIVFIPHEINQNLLSGRQATISVYCDVSSFMYYRAIYQSCNYCIANMNQKIELQRLAVSGIVGESAAGVVEPLVYQNVSLFNPTNGFASFLLPAIMVLILFQTLFLAITMLAGTSRGENRFHELVHPSSHKGRFLRVIIGKALFYFLVYSVWVFYALIIVPRIFDLPHMAGTADLLIFMTPFLLAAIFFSMTISVFMPHRETSMMLFMFFSLILLFLSGVTWPVSNIGMFWKLFAWIFPSTHAVQAYVKLNTMGASLQQVRYEFFSLWVQVGLYFSSTFIAYRWQIMKSIQQDQSKAF